MIQFILRNPNHSGMNDEPFRKKGSAKYDNNQTAEKLSVLLLTHQFREMKTLVALLME